MELVSDRTVVTLTSIITARIAPGTEIWSDQWASYHNVGTIPGVTAHRIVNHSVQFVRVKGPFDLCSIYVIVTSGVHTNIVEGCWNRWKMKNQTNKGSTQNVSDFVC